MKMRSRDKQNLACHPSLAEGVDATPRRVRGAALQLIHQGDARWLRHELTLTAGQAWSGLLSRPGMLLCLRLV